MVRRKALLSSKLLTFNSTNCGKQILLQKISKSVTFNPNVVQIPKPLIIAHFEAPPSPAKSLTKHPPYERQAQIEWAQLKLQQGVAPEQSLDTWTTFVEDLVAFKRVTWRPSIRSRYLKRTAYQR